MANQTNISGSLVDKLVSIRSVFSKSPKTSEGTTSNVNAVASTPKNGTKSVRNSTTNNAFYTTISEGQMKPLQKGEGLANIFAKIYNLLKMEHEEEVKHYEMQKNSSRITKFHPDNFTGIKTTSTTAIKEEQKDDSESMFKKMFGFLFKGLKLILTGLTDVIFGALKFVSGLLWSVTKAVTLGAGKVILQVGEFVGKMVGNLMKNVIAEMVSLVGKSVNVLGEKLAKLLISRGVGLGSSGSGGSKAAGAAAGIAASSVGYIFGDDTFEDFFVKSLLSGTAGAVGGPGVGVATAGALSFLQTMQKENLAYRDFIYGTKYTEKAKDFAVQNAGGLTNYAIESDQKRQLDKLKDEHQNILIPQLESEGLKVEKKKDGELLFRNSDGKEMSWIETFKYFEEQKLKKYLRGNISDPISGKLEDWIEDAKSKSGNLTETIEDTAINLGFKAEEQYNRAFEEIREKGSSVGDSLTKLFKDLNLTKDNAEFAPPIIQKESKVINMGKGGSSLTMDSSVPVRIDDPTLKKIQSSNLRPV